MTREEALDWIKARKEHYEFDDNCQPLAEALEMAIKALEQEPRIGHWVQTEKTNTYSKWKCSECEMLVITSQTPWYKHCPMCGLKMVEPQESEDKE